MMLAIVVGNILATIFVILNSVPGAYYHIGFPVVNRYVWGMYGSVFVIWNRILLSLGTLLTHRYLLTTDTLSLVWLPSLGRRGMSLRLPHGPRPLARKTHPESYVRINRNDNSTVRSIHHLQYPFSPGNLDPTSQAEELLLFL